LEGFSGITGKSGKYQKWENMENMENGKYGKWPENTGSLTLGQQHPCEISSTHLMINGVIICSDPGDNLEQIQWESVSTVIMDSFYSQDTTPLVRDINTDKVT